MNDSIIKIAFGGLTALLVGFIIYWFYLRKGSKKSRCRNCSAPKYICDCPIWAK